MIDSMSRSSDRLRSPGKGPRQARPRHQEITMPKYLLLKHYRGGPAPHRPVPPMDQWTPEDVEAHMAFLKHVSELLEENGEYVDAQALTPARTWVRYGGHGRLELSKFHAPPGGGGDLHAPANTPGIRHVAFAVDDIDAVVACSRTRG